jgi:hypothetical protein
LFTYSQLTGVMTQDGEVIGEGYSGNAAGKNNPAMQNVPNVGPLPQGLWEIGIPEDRNGTLGPVAMPLAPEDGTETFGRSEFWIHGDSAAHPGLASHGCIIMPRSVRQLIADSGETVLQVTA